MINFNIDENSTIEEVEAAIEQVEAVIRTIPVDEVASPSEIKLFNDLNGYLQDLEWRADDLYHVEDQFCGAVL